MRVLMLTLWYPNLENPIFGTFIHEQVTALQRLGVDVRVAQPVALTPPPLPIMSEKYKKLGMIPRSEVYKGVRVYHPRYLSLPRHLLFEMAGRWMLKGVKPMLANVYEKWPFDILHAHTTYPCGWCANRLRDKYLPKIKVVHTIHRVSVIDVPTYNSRCKRRVQESLESSDWNVFVSKEGLRLALLYTQGRIRNKMSYITNGVNVSQFTLSPRESDEVQKLKRKYSDSINILFIGYLIERKGVKELLRGFDMLPKLGVRAKARLFLVGRNMMGSYVDSFVRRHQLSDRVFTVGPVPHDRIKIWLGFADIFVLPSHSEGLATVLFEALFMGKCSILTKVGGTCDIVRHMEHAYLISPGSAHEVATAIATLMGSPSLREKLGRNGRRLIERKYTWQINARRNLKVYRRLVGNCEKDAKSLGA